MLSPIAVFAYNRPYCLHQTLNSLSQNKEAIKSELFVFIDGPKSTNESHLVDYVEEIANSFSRFFKSLTIFKSELNNGLVKSIRTGITKMLNNYSNLIIIEDDIIFPNNFKQLLLKNLKKIPSDWDIIYLGVTRPCGKLYKENIYKPSIDKCSKDNGGLFGYMVNNRSADKIYNLINRKINKMVDHTIREYFPSLKVFIIYPFLINHNYNIISDRKQNGYYSKNYIDASNIIKVIN